MAEIIDITTDRQRAIDAGCAVLREGLPIAIPTETVYGLAADATNPAADRAYLRDQGTAAVQSADLPYGRPRHGRGLCDVRPDIAGAGRGLLAGAADDRRAAEAGERHSCAGDRRSRHRRHPRAEGFCRRTDPRLRPSAGCAQRQHIRQDQRHQRCACRCRPRRQDPPDPRCRASDVGVESTIVKVENGKIGCCVRADCRPPRSSASPAEASPPEDGVRCDRGAGHAGLALCAGCCRSAGCDRRRGPARR
jgi:hypothetical protein